MAQNTTIPLAPWGLRPGRRAPVRPRVRLSPGLLSARWPRHPALVVQPGEVLLDPLDVAECLAVAPARHPRRDALDAGPDVRVELRGAGGALGVQDGAAPGVVAREHELAAMEPARFLLPLPPQPAIVRDPRRDVALGVVDRVPADVRVPGHDLAVGRRHELHDPARAHVAAGGAVEVALGEPLRLEHPPVVGRAEIAL